MRKFLALAVLASSALVATSAAAAPTIDFETATCNGCTSFTEFGVTFSNANGNGMDVANFGVQSGGTNGLAVYSDTDGNYLIGDMAFLATGITLDFGNDDPFFTNVGDLAMLQVFLANILVGTSQVLLNRDDIMNQNISYVGNAFDSFTFAYTDAAGLPYTGGGDAATGLIEIVDNITFQAVPEPSTWAMMLLGFGIAGAALRRGKRRSTAVRMAIA